MDRYAEVVSYWDYAWRLGKGPYDVQVMFCWADHAHDLIAVLNSASTASAQGTVSMFQAALKLRSRASNSRRQA